MAGSPLLGIVLSITPAAPRQPRVGLEGTDAALWLCGDTWQGPLAKLFSSRQALETQTRAGGVRISAGAEGPLVALHNTEARPPAIPCGARSPRDRSRSREQLQPTAAADASATRGDGSPGAAASSDRAVPGRARRSGPLPWQPAPRPAIGHTCLYLVLVKQRGTRLACPSPAPVTRSGIGGAGPFPASQLRWQRYRPSLRVLGGPGLLRAARPRLRAPDPPHRCGGVGSPWVSGQWVRGSAPGRSEGVAVRRNAVCEACGVRPGPSAAPASVRRPG